MEHGQTDKIIHEAYIQSAEFYDVLSNTEWDLRREAIASELKSVPIDKGPILDIGAGTGRGAELVAKTLPQADIIAVEPSAMMRIGLMSRLMANEKLRQNTTVFPGPMEDFDLPEHLSAVLILGVIGFIGESARKKMWQALAKRLDRNGLVIVDVMMIDKPQAVSNRQIACTKVGSHFYEIWLEGAPVDEQIMRWTTTYQVRDGSSILRCFRLNYGWQTFGLDQIESETSKLGFYFSHLSEVSTPTGVLRFGP